jgi:hypothetical protein
MHVNEHRWIANVPGVWVSIEIESCALQSGILCNGYRCGWWNLRGVSFRELSSIAVIGSGQR